MERQEQMVNSVVLLRVCAGNGQRDKAAVLNLSATYGSGNGMGQMGTLPQTTHRTHPEPVATCEIQCEPTHRVLRRDYRIVPIGWKAGTLTY